MMPDTEFEMRVVFYISGHGYGHAVRDVEIIKALLKRQPDCEIHFRTGAPRWLFEPLLNSNVLYHRRELDFGVRQKNSFSADKERTFIGYVDLLQRKEQLVAEEAEFLKTCQPDVILSDITPFAFDAAAAFGKRAVAVGNFSWDWIYSRFLRETPRYEFVVRDIKASYAKAERLYRIPFYGDMSVFPNIEDVPLIGRKATLPADAVRKKIGMPNNSSQKFVLLGLRMADLEDVNWRKIESIRGVTFVAVSRDIQLENCIHVEEGEPPFEDLLGACDAVLSKPGYSMVSEVIVNRTPIVFVPRSDFAEDPYLIEGLQKYAVCEELPQIAYFKGEWQGAFDRLFARPNIWPGMAANGADVVARKILGAVSETNNCTN